MIREAIAKHACLVGTRFGETGLGASDVHASHTRLPLLRSGDDDGACLIEPAVRCNHCGYCLSLGH